MRPERLLTPNLRRNAAMWLSTVRTEITNSAAISGLVSRLSTAASTAVSCEVSSPQTGRTIATQ